MIVVHGTSDVRAGARGGAFAIGNFDGVHRGHQALLRAATDRAAALGAPAGVILFEPHPREFFQPDKPHFRLTPIERKLELLEQFGLDVAVVLKFDPALAGLPAQAFIERIVVDALAARHVVVGYDFHFGKARAGDPGTMRRAGEALGFGVTVVAQVGEAGEVFSSNAIRAELAQGDVTGAAQMLGHWWRVSGKVVGGFRRGTDVFKALALGATAVGVGRPYMWGLASFGQDGVEAVLDILRRELQLIMRQSGTTTVAAIGSNHIVQRR